MTAAEQTAHAVTLTGVHISTPTPGRPRLLTLRPGPPATIKLGDLSGMGIDWVYAADQVTPVSVTLYDLDSPNHLTIYPTTTVNFGGADVPLMRALRYLTAPVEDDGAVRVDRLLAALAREDRQGPTRRPITDGELRLYTNDEGTWSVAANDVWVDGIFDSRETATHAARHADPAVLAAIVPRICHYDRENRAITMADLEAGITPADQPAGGDPS